MDVLVNMTHARAMNYCVPGMKLSCIKYGLDFRKFVKHGLPASELLAVGDAQIDALVEVAQRE